MSWQTAVAVVQKGPWLEQGRLGNDARLLGKGLEAQVLGKASPKWKQHLTAEKSGFCNIGAMHCGLAGTVADEKN